jgi:calmodulin
MGNKSKITLDDCIPFCEKEALNGRDKPDDILEAFKIFDKEGMGYISVKELKHILCNMAEKFTDDEIKDTITALGGENTTINYTDLVKQICS